jgi:hypothetical protein
MEHPDYYRLREQLIEFLEVHAHHKKLGATQSADTPEMPSAKAAA